MNVYVAVFLCIGAGYLLGCFSTGLITGKAFAKLDIRTKGSGNAGATNMLRTLGWVPGLVTVIGDTCKAVLACFFGSLLFGENGAYIAGVACVIGHNWPLPYKFRGGKGVASSLGVLLFTNPAIALTVLTLEVIVIACTRTVSIASIAAGLCNALMALCFLRGTPVGLASLLLLSAMLLFSHRSNIARLLSGNENKLDFAKINKISRKKRP